MSLIDVKSVLKEAEAELQKERTERAKGLIKDKMRQIQKAEQIVANLKRELEDLYADIGRQVV